tara:strand:- start:292 stop:504 length:213 start_codon:yes stop_codon:yes gene_type:complete
MMDFNEAYGLRSVRLLNTQEKKRKIVKLREIADQVLSSDLLYPVVALIIALCVVIMLFSMNNKLNRLLNQ